MKDNFNALREGRGKYLPLFAIGLLCFILGYTTEISGLYILGMAPFPAALLAMAFFRDPKRTIPDAPGLVVCPADGTIVGVEDFNETPHFTGPCKRVSVFLSVLNVHVNRAPAAGTVKDIQYRPGKFLDARSPKATDVNEALSLYLDTEHGPMTVRQISGLIARHIVCRCTVGDRLERGQKYGMIKFGSRTEIYLPPNAEILVKVGDKVKAGENVISRFT